MLSRPVKRLCSALLAALICGMLCLPLVSYAESESFRLAEGSIIIGAEGDGLSVTVGDKRTTVSADTEIVIDGADTATSNTITVKDNVTASVTLSGVRIESTGFLRAPIELVGAENVTFTLKGANALTAPAYMAALQVNRYAKITLKGDGSLSARGGESAAGIGGGWKSGTPAAPCGAITLAGSVTVSAYGGDFGAGIGSGEGGVSGVIEIRDHARVYALGGKYGAAIGSGSGARSKGITVSGSANVDAAGGEGAAAIGCGRLGSASKITLGGECVLRVSGGAGGAGIGSGQNGSATAVLIRESATVRARGGEGAAAIGAGQDSSLSVGVTVSGFSSVFAVGGESAAGIGGSASSAGILTVTDSATVESYGGKYGAGIGSGRRGSITKILISGRASVLSGGGLNGAGIGAGESGSFEAIRISSLSNVLALGGKYGAGIGGGKTAVCGTIGISDSAQVTAQGGNFGAGIGTGAKNAPDALPTAGTIFVTGDASVRAAGGKDAAGIGGGLYASGGRVTVSDTASVDAYADLTVGIDKSKTEQKADYSVVNAALEKVPKNLDEFTEDSVAILQGAIKEVVYDLPATKQPQVDAYAAAIERALSILVKKTVKRTVTPGKASFSSGETIAVDWQGAASPKDRIIILKKGHLPTDTEIDPVLRVPYGSPLFSYNCADEKGAAVPEGTALFTVEEDHFLCDLGYAGLPEGAYSVYLCLEGSDAPAAAANFEVTDTKYLGANYAAVEEAIAGVPRDSAQYTKESWAALQSAIGAVDYTLTGKDQDKIAGYAKAIRDAIAALVKVSATRSVTLPGGKEETYTVSLLTHSAKDEKHRTLSLAQSAGEPTEMGWGLIPLESTNVEAPVKDSVVSAINRVTVPEEIIVSQNESFNTQNIPASKIGAGAGCTMNGSLAVKDTALFNGQTPALTVTLEYGAAIGTLSYAYNAGESLTLPAAPLCPGYLFKSWSTDEGGASQVSGDFIVSSNLTFYANWDLVPVSIAKDFRFSSGALGVSYEDRLQLQQESANYTVSVSSGQLPKGLILDPATGTVSGVPTDLGTSEFSLLIVDANGKRTEESYSITVYQPVEMTFTFQTSSNEQSGTTGEILFYYTYRDRGNDTLKESAPVNLSQLLKAQSPTALTPGSTDTVTLTVGAYVGVPVQLFFENTSPDDGYRIDKVTISSPGGDGMEEFEKTYRINTWIGNIDDPNFFESGLFTLFLILFIVLLLLVGLFLFLRHKNRKNEKGASAKKQPLSEKLAALRGKSAPRLNIPRKAPSQTPPPRPANAPRPTAAPRPASAPRPANTPRPVNAPRPANAPRPVQRPPQEPKK